MKKTLTLLLTLFTISLFSQSNDVKLYCKAGYLVNKEKTPNISLILQCPDKKDLETPCYFNLQLPLGEYSYLSKDVNDTAEILVTKQLVFLLKISKDSEFYIIRE